MKSTVSLTAQDGRSDPEVRTRIIEAALELLQDVGPARLRIQEVSNRAGVSATLLYYYFDGKNALIAEAYATDYASILDDDLATFHAIFTDATSPEDALSILRNTSIEAFRDPDARRRRLDALAAAQHDHAVAAAIASRQRTFHDELRALIMDLQDRGWLAESVDANAFMLATMALPLGLVFQDLDPNLDVDMTTYLLTVLPRPRQR